MLLMAGSKSLKPYIYIILWYELDRALFVQKQMHIGLSDYHLLWQRANLGSMLQEWLFYPCWITDGVWLILC